MLSDVEDFLLGKKSPSDYHVKKFTSPMGDNFKLVKKVVTIVHTRTIDNYLTKIDERIGTKDSLIKITNDVTQRIFTLELTKEFFDMATSNDEEYEDIVSDFLISGTSAIYITRKNNPYALLYSFTFLPSDLFERRKLYFPCSDVYTNTSAYTKKLIVGYTYRERKPL
jgi:hypothetical protein